MIVRVFGSTIQSVCTPIKKYSSIGIGIRFQSPKADKEAGGPEKMPGAGLQPLVLQATILNRPVVKPTRPRQGPA